MSHLSSEFLVVSEPSPHVLHVQLARAPVNAVNEEFWRAFGTLFERITTDAPDTRVVVLSSALPKIFVAGIDLATLGALPAGLTDGARTGFAIRSHLLQFQQAIIAPSKCGVPVIAAMHGKVIGLGVDIMCACDIRYASENTTFTIKEVDVGLAPDLGTLAFVQKVSGNASFVREMAYTSRFFGAQQALTGGLVSKIVPSSGQGVEGPRDGVVAAALETAKLIASKSPVAVRGTKAILNHALDHTVAENLEYTSVWNAFALQSDDMTAIVKATKDKPAVFSKL